MLRLALLLGVMWQAGELRPSAQVQGGPTSRLVYLEGRALFECRIELPEGYDPDQTYPLVLGLHGMGGSAEQFAQLSKPFTSSGLIFAALQAPYPFLRSGRIGYDWGLTHLEVPALEKEAVSLTVRQVADLAEELSQRFPGTPLYVLGFSQGAVISYITAIEHPDLFTGLIAIGVGIDQSWFAGNTLANGKRVRVLVAHGDKDERVSLEEMLRTQALLQRHGYDVTLRRFLGSHTVPESLLKEVVKWITPEVGPR